MYSLQPSRGPGLGLQCPVDGAGAARQLDEPVALDRGLPGDGLLGSATCSWMPRRARRARPGPVLAADDLIMAPAGEAGRPWLDEDVPVGDALAEVLAAPLPDHVRDVQGCALRG